MRAHEQFISPSTLVIDCGSVKRSVCPVCFSIAERRGFTFIGGHPLAGLQYSGYRHARADLYAGQPMSCSCRPRFMTPILFCGPEALSPAAFGSFSITTAAKHDQIIAYTSQLAHVVSSAFIKSPTAQKASFAVCYKDLTRVAELNADMWTELFMDNADNLTEEIGVITGARSAIATRYRAEMKPSCTPCSSGVDCQAQGRWAVFRCARKAACDERDQSRCRVA